jgi:hypothetical protein
MYCSNDDSSTARRRLESLIHGILPAEIKRRNVRTEMVNLSAASEIVRSTEVIIFYIPI